MDDKHFNNLEKKHRQALVKERIMRKLSESWEADNDHPYLQMHGIKHHDLSVDKKGNLLAVGIDLEASFKAGKFAPQAVTMLTIISTEKTRVEKWSVSKGAAVMIGHQEFRRIAKNPDQAHLIFVTDNYPTGGFLYENYGHLGIPVAVALRPSNVKSIVKIFREKFPKVQVIVLLNSDPQTATNHHKISKDCKKAGAIVLHSLFFKRELEAVLDNISEYFRAEDALLNAVGNDSLQTILGSEIRHHHG